MTEVGDKLDVVLQQDSLAGMKHNLSKETPHSHTMLILRTQLFSQASQRFHNNVHHIHWALQLCFQTKKHLHRYLIFPLNSLNS